MNLSSEKRTKQLFIIYLVLLTWIIVCKLHLDPFYLLHMNFRSLNLIPFGASSIVNGAVDGREIFLNAAAFVPFGMFLSALREKWPALRKIAAAALLSLIFEAAQYVFAVGGSDITDVLMNTLGGALGVGAYALLRRALKERALPVLNALALAGTAALLVFLGVVLAVN